MDKALECLKNELRSIENRQEQSIELSHRYDSLTLLLYILLLILSVLTSWLFKHRRFRYVHETGLSIFYGLIAGIIIRYATPSKMLSAERMFLPVHPNISCSDIMPPQRIHLYLPVHVPIVHPQVVPDVNSSTTQSPTSTTSMPTTYTSVTNEVERLIYSYALLHQVKDENAMHRELQEKVTFDSEIFFNILLPPIIFTAGYSMKRKHFFRNFGAITTYAFAGTVISSAVTGVVCYLTSRIFPSLRAILSFSDCLLFGAMISATDPVTVLAIFNDLAVDVTLYALVFGESVLNDAVAIVLAQSVEEYGHLSEGNLSGMAVLKAVGNFAAVFGGAFAIGVATGCITALLTKFTHIRDHPVLETALFTLMSYCTFLASEAIGLTGIVAVLFCGVTQAHYTYNNLSEESQIWTKEFFELLNFMAENFVFTYIGVSVFTFQQHNWHVGFILCALFACVLGRVAHVYPLSFLLNLGRSDKISLNKQHMIMWSGLRGAMAFSLAIRNVSSPARQLFLTTTLVIVMVTVVVFGGMATPLLQLLKIKIGAHDGLQYGNDTLPRIPSSGVRRTDLWRHSTESVSTSDPPCQPDEATTLPHGSPQRRRTIIARAWANLDNNLLKPLLTHSGPLLSETLPGCCLRCAELFTTDEQLIRCTTSNTQLPRNVTALTRAAVSVVPQHAGYREAADGHDEHNDFRYHKSRLDGDAELDDDIVDTGNVEGHIVFRSDSAERLHSSSGLDENVQDGMSQQGPRGIMNPLYQA